MAADPRLYFQSQDEANDWLDFEADGEDREQAFYAENDRYHEWQRWRELWVVGAAPELTP